MLAVAGLAIVIWTIKLDWIERIFGYGGLCMLVFAVAAVKLAPDWGQVGNGFIPTSPARQSGPVRVLRDRAPRCRDDPVRGLLLLVRRDRGRLDEEGPRLNRANAIVGYSLGGILSLALMIVGSAVFLQHGISPEHLGSIALGSEEPLGKIGLLVALVGILFAVGGASIDTVFSGAYNLAQFFGWEWGRYRHPSGAPRFALTWMFLLVFALAIVMTGVDPVMLTEYAVIFSAVALPLTYIPILLVANDRRYMGGSPTDGSPTRWDRLPRGDPDRRDHRRSADDPDQRGTELMSRIYLARNVLDHQLLDANGRRCGKVDDLAIEGGAGETAAVVAILAGPGVWPQRSGRLGRLAGRLGGSKRVSVPWSEVKRVSSAVELRNQATTMD